MKWLIIRLLLIRHSEGFILEMDTSNHSNDNPFEDEEAPRMTWHTSFRGAVENVDERQELGEDVYSLIFVAPVFGTTFMFAFYVVFLKLMLFT